MRFIHIRQNSNHIKCKPVKVGVSGEFGYLAVGASITFAIKSVKNWDLSRAVIRLDTMLFSSCTKEQVMKTITRQPRLNSA